MTTTARPSAPRRSAWRLAALASGSCVFWFAVASPLSQHHHRSLTMHMIQHLLIMCAAAPLLLIGAPAIAGSSLCLRGLLRRHPIRCDRTRRARVAAIWTRVRHAIAHPVFCWLAGTGAVVGWHIPRVFAWSMASIPAHAVQQISFLAAGLLFWWPVVQCWPNDARAPAWFIPLYLFTATLPCDALSAFLVFCGRVVYPTLQSTQAGPSLADQALAGALMWVTVTLIYLVPALVATMRLLSPGREALPHATTGR